MTSSGTLDHHDRVAAARDDQVDVRLLELLRGRIEDELTVDAADADAGDRSRERDVRHRQRRGRTAQRDHVGIAVLLGRQHGRDDLRLRVPALREQRAQRAVDEAGGQDLLLRRLALALEEAARDLARRERLLLIIDGQRQEIDVLSRRRLRGRGDQNDGVAVANQR
jgi:hypothetical protein